MPPHSGQSLTLDDTTRASNPGRLRVQWPVYLRCFPDEVQFWVSTMAFIVLAATASGRLWALCFAPPVMWVLAVSLIRARERFLHGDVNPALVVGPDLIAVYTDLTTGRVAYPVVKIKRQPLSRTVARHLTAGGKIAAVSLYAGRPDHEWWQDFDPVAAPCATADRSELDRLVQSVPEHEWRWLEEGLRQVGTSLSPGLYPVQLSGLCSGNSGGEAEVRLP
jgi:hypothetical protein